MVAGTVYDSATSALSSVRPTPNNAIGQKFTVSDFMPIINNKFIGFIMLYLNPTPLLQAGTPVAVHIDFELSTTTKFLETNTTVKIDNLLEDSTRLFDISAGASYAVTDTWYYVGKLKAFPSDPNTPVLTIDWDATHRSSPISTTADGVTVDVTITITSLSSMETLVLAPTVQSL